MIIKRFPSILILCIFAFATGVVCQQTSLSLKDLSPSERFSSVEGGFSMAVPKTGASYTAIGEAELGAGNKGGQYVWQLREGVVIINFVEFGPSVGSFTQETLKIYIVSVTKSFFDGVKGKIVSEEYGQSGTYRADFELEDGRKGMARIYSRGREAINVFGVISKDGADSQALITKAMDSFAMLSPEKKME